MYHLYLVARRGEPAEAPRFAGEIMLQARAAARARERERLVARPRRARAAESRAGLFPALGRAGRALARGRPSHA